MQLRDYKNAELELKKRRPPRPEQSHLLEDLSSTFYLAGNYPGTLAVLDAVAKSKNLPPALFIRALCYDKLQQNSGRPGRLPEISGTRPGQNPDQVWQAQQRSIVLKKVLEKKR